MILPPGPVAFQVTGKPIMPEEKEHPAVTEYKNSAQVTVCVKGKTGWVTTTVGTIGQLQHEKVGLKNSTGGLTFKFEIRRHV